MIRFRAILWIWVILFVSPQIVSADLQDEVNDLFNSAGLATSTTDAAVFEGQHNGYMTGGSIKARAPYKKIDMFNVQAPHLTAGCGGIDIFLGGLSFVSLDEFKAMLQTMAENAPGYAVQVAMESMCPTCNSVLKDLADKINQARDFLGNSCQMTQILTNSARQKTGVGLAKGCEKKNLLKGGNNDGVALRQRCYNNSSGDLTSYVADVKQTFKDIYDDISGSDGSTTSTTVSADQNYDYKTILVPPGNFFYQELLKTYPGKAASSVFTRRLILSMTGFPYSIYDDADGSVDTKWQPPTLSYKTFIYGKEKAGDPDVVLMTCGDDLCSPDEPSTSGVDSYSEETITGYVSFKDKVRDKLIGIWDKLAADSSSASFITDEEKAFINSVSIPVYKDLKFMAFTRNEGFAMQYINKVSGLVANEMGYQYLSDIRRLVNNTLSSMDVPVEVKQQARDTIMDVLNEQDKVFKRESEEIERLTTRISLSKMIENEINNRVPAVLKARNFSF